MKILLRSDYALGVAAMVAVIFTCSGWISISSWGVRHSLNAWGITFLRFATAALVTSLWAVGASLLVYNLRTNSQPSAQLRS